MKAYLETCTLEVHFELKTAVKREAIFAKTIRQYLDRPNLLKLILYLDENTLHVCHESFMPLLEKALDWQ